MACPPLATSLHAADPLGTLRRHAQAPPATRRCRCRGRNTRRRGRPAVTAIAAGQPGAARHPRGAAGRGRRCAPLHAHLRPRRWDLRIGDDRQRRDGARARRGRQPRRAGRAAGAQRPDPEVRRPAGPGCRLLVPRLHRCHAVVADCRASRARSTSAAARMRSRWQPQHSARDPVAAGAGAPALSSAAAERGQRLGRHHAALGLRAVHQRAVVPREALLRPGAPRGHAPSLQPPVPSLQPRHARVPRARACCATTRCAADATRAFT